MEGKEDAKYYLKEYTDKLLKSQAEYGVVAKQIEDLMGQNASTPVPNYPERLAALEEQRDALATEIRLIMLSQKVFQQAVDYEKEQAHKSVIAQVEELLSTRITGNLATGRFVQTNKGMFPQMDIKDKSMLRNEQGIIYRQLDDLYYDGQLDIKTWQSMKIEVGKEYEQLIGHAPAPKKQEINTQRGASGYGFADRGRKTPVSNKEQEPEKKEKEEEKPEPKNVGWREAMMKEFGFDEADLDALFEQQEIIERQNREIENAENIEQMGRRMR